jgi:hypothetical protein
VLVDDPAPECGSKVERLAAPDHRFRESEGLGWGQAAEVHGHQERRHLVVGNLASRVAEHELGQLPGRELLAVPLALDDLGRVDHGAPVTTPARLTA